MNEYLKQKAQEIELKDAAFPSLKYTTLFIEAIKHLNSQAEDEQQFFWLIERVKSQSDDQQLKTHQATIEQVKYQLPLKNLRLWIDVLLTKFNKSAIDSRGDLKNFGELDLGLEFIGLVAESMVRVIMSKDQS